MELSDQNKIKIDFLNSRIARVRISSSESDFGDSALNLYEFIQKISDDVEVEETKRKDGWELYTADLTVSYSGKSGELTVKRTGNGQCLLCQTSFDWKPEFDNLEAIIEHAWIWEKKFSSTQKDNDC